MSEIASSEDSKFKTFFLGQDDSGLLSLGRCLAIIGGSSVSRSNLSPLWLGSFICFVVVVVVVFFLKCRNSENYFGFSVDVFSELNQTVNGRFYARDVRLLKLRKHLNYAQNTDPQSVSLWITPMNYIKGTTLKWTTAT